MRAYMFEGTPEEVADAMKHLGAGASKTAIAVAAEPVTVTPSPASGGDDFEYVDLGVARRVLTRIPLSDEQRAVLVAMYEADEKKGILASELQSKIKYSKAQFAGLMGAFGRRVASTKGYVAYSAFFMQEWENEAGCYRYWLPPSLREAVKIEIIDK